MSGVSGTDASEPLGSLSGGRAAAAAATACLLLIPLQLGWIPFLDRAWAFNLWQYQPAAFGLALALALLPFCSSRSRGVILRWLERALGAVSAAPPALLWGSFLLLPFALWLLREREFFGDSLFLMVASLSGFRFAVPDIGAFFLFATSVRSAQILGVPPAAAVQAAVCLFGAVAIALFVIVSRYLSDHAGQRALILGLALSGGVFRTFIGHVEVYSFVLTFAALYLWSAFAYLRGRVHWTLPCLVLGCGVWLHLSFAFLTPTLPLLFRLADPDGRLSMLVRRTTAAAGLCLLPIVLFLLSMAALGYHEDLLRTWNKFQQIVGLLPSRHFEGGSFIRLWWEERVAGTDYVLLSRPHLKHLLNAYHLLAPAALPVLVAMAVLARRRFVETPQAAFLSGACACMVLYSLIVRPLWGPHDWDMFTLTAVLLGLLAGTLLTRHVEGPRLGHLGVVLLAGTWLLVTIPFVAAAISPVQQAGPFAHGAVTPSADDTNWDLFLKQVEEWL